MTSCWWRTRHPQQGDGPSYVAGLEPMGRTSLDEVGPQLPHVGVIVDDDAAADDVPRQPDCDLLSPTRPGHAGRGLVQHASRKAFSVQHGLQLRDSLGVPPGGRNDDIGAASRHDLIEGLDARGVQIPVSIPPADRREHAIDVEKNHPLHHEVNDRQSAVLMQARVSPAPADLGPGEEMPPAAARPRACGARAESSLTRALFRQILGRIQRIAWHPT